MVRVVLRLFGMVVLLAGGVLAVTRGAEPPVECVAYVVTYEDGSPIYRVCPNDRVPRMVSKTSDYFRGLALSGDRKWFAFVVSGSFEDTLALMHIDGTGYREIYQKQGMNSPVWSPDNQWIALNFLDDGIYLIRPDGSDLHPLVGDSVLKWYVSTLSWSPDGQWIALCSDAGLYRLRPDGTGLQRLTPASGFLSAPMWSSDSQWIAYRYSSDQGGTEEEIRIIRADGSEVRNIISGPENRIGLWAWSPDSQWIVFSPNGTTVYRMATDGSQPQIVTRAVFYNQPFFVWSPDSEWIMSAGKMWSRPDIDFALYRIRPDGSDLQPLAFMPGIATDFMSLPAPAKPWHNWIPIVLGGLMVALSFFQPASIRVPLLNRIVRVRRMSINGG